MEHSAIQRKELVIRSIIWKNLQRTVLSVKIQLWDFPGSAVVKILCFQCRGAQVRSLVKELRSRMPHGAAKKTKQNRSWLPGNKEGVGPREVGVIIKGNRREPRGQCQYLVVISHFNFARCYHHWGTRWRGQESSRYCFCCCFYNCMWICNYLKLKKFNIKNGQKI